VTATWDDGEASLTGLGLVSVAQLAHRIGPVPASADTHATGATPVRARDLLLREGHPDAYAIARELPDPDGPAAEISGADAGGEVEEIAVPGPDRDGGGRAGGRRRRPRRGGDRGERRG
jgi:hypothetical protein